MPRKPTKPPARESQHSDPASGESAIRKVLRDQLISWLQRTIDRLENHARENDLAAGEQIYFWDTAKEYAINCLTSEDTMLLGSRPDGFTTLGEVILTFKRFYGHLTNNDRRPSEEVTPPPPLTAIEDSVLEIIRNHPEGIQGPGILEALAKIHENPPHQGTLTRHFIPKLKKWCGVKNRRGVGYYLPKT